MYRSDVEIFGQHCDSVVNLCNGTIIARTLFSPGGVPVPTPVHQRLFTLLRSLAEIPDRELERAGAIFHPTEVRRGALLLRAGERPQTLAFVSAGLLRLYYIGCEGREFTKSFCVEGEIVAAYSALLLDSPSRLFIEALEDSQLLVADYQAYQALAAQHPCWTIVGQRRAEALFIKKELREGALLLDDAETRYLQFLAEYPGLEARLKQHQIASYLGISPVSLSRVRARFRSKGG
jgi:CRP-like cAMP-binding protein